MVGYCTSRLECNSLASPWAENTMILGFKLWLWYAATLLLVFVGLEFFLWWLIIPLFYLLDAPVIYHGRLVQIGVDIVERETEENEQSKFVVTSERDQRNQKDGFEHVEATDKNWEHGLEPIARIPETRKGLLIAISDDDIDLLSLVASGLDIMGYDVIAVPDKRELLNKLSSIKPDAIITDIHSPGMNGFEFVEEAKKDPLTNHIPIIVATSWADVHNLIEMQKLGASDFISKPYDSEEILYSIRRAIKQTQHSISGKAVDTLLV